MTLLNQYLPFSRSWCLLFGTVAHLTDVRVGGRLKLNVNTTTMWLLPQNMVATKHDYGHEMTALSQYCMFYFSSRIRALWKSARFIRQIIRKKCPCKQSGFLKKFPRLTSAVPKLLWCRRFACLDELISKKGLICHFCALGSISTGAV